METSDFYKGRVAVLDFFPSGVIPKNANFLVIKNDGASTASIEFSTSKGGKTFVPGYGIINTLTPLVYNVPAASTSVVFLSDIYAYLKGVATLSGLVTVSAVRVVGKPVIGAFDGGRLRAPGILFKNEVLQCQ